MTRRVLAAWLALLVVGPAWPAFASGPARLVVIVGVPGDDEHAKQFGVYAGKLLDAAKAGALAADHVVYLADKPERDPQRIKGPSTREHIMQVFGELGKTAGAEDEIIVVLIGHGSAGAQQSQFNVPGPDISAEDFAKLLQPFATQRIVFVNTASASGGFQQVLAGPRRTIITATKTPGERNETRFPEFFVQAFGDPSSDADKDGRTSVLEAFNYAKAAVERAYAQSGYIPTEHAVVDDRAEAARVYLSAPAPAVPATVTDPALRKLYEEKRALEDKIESLRLRKAEMDPAQYESALEKLATELALKTKAIRELEKTIK
jgi:hypothetical protein